MAFEIGGRLAAFVHPDLAKMERPKRGLSAFDDIERLDQLGEVGKRPRQPVDLVDDDHVDLSRASASTAPTPSSQPNEAGLAHDLAEPAHAHEARRLEVGVDARLGDHAAIADQHDALQPKAHAQLPHLIGIVVRETEFCGQRLAGDGLPLVLSRHSGLAAFSVAG